MKTDKLNRGQESEGMSECCNYPIIDFRTKTRGLIKVCSQCLQEVESDQPHRQLYHLNCDKCGATYWSQEGFPKPQLCINCDQPVKAEAKTAEFETAEKMLEDGINDGHYANILDVINVDTSTPFFKEIVQFAKEYASQQPENNKEYLINE